MKPILSTTYPCSSNAEIHASPQETASSQNFFDSLPSELILEIFSHLHYRDLSACAEVCKFWRSLSSDDQLIPKLKSKIIKYEKFFDTFFSSKRWIAHFGEGVISKKDHLAELFLLPSNIKAILNQPCNLFEKGKRIKDTHVLVFIPETIYGKPLDLRTFAALLQERPENQGYSFDYVADTILQQASGHGPHWVLMTKKVIPATTHCDSGIGTLNYLGYDILDPLTLAVVSTTVAMQTGERCCYQQFWSNTRGYTQPKMFSYCQFSHGTTPHDLPVAGLSSQGFMAYFLNVYEGCGMGFAGLYRLPQTYNLEHKVNQHRPKIKDLV